MKLLFACLPFVMLAGAAAAQNAAVTDSAVACRSVADIKKAYDLQAKSAAAADTFVKGKESSGACQRLVRGLKVTIEQKQPPFSCVRLSGDFDCYWIMGTVVE
ncbi:hypothetical protein [Methylovirgula sp. 4M-Z18]|uniref:hypothetical protein n=1 Tax=Methylovirgula sp. 4M-Z18 TaxID=2293567 RepID=UPI000E2FCDC5|nr:hypothetical protein [Methylovirgula sp. 4M-Z18]RFB78667.1 hypothetical protein DYH55_15835 [Methylovirgula sp. 4M-Z18]